jgi:hypothetical protein
MSDCSAAAVPAAKDPAAAAGRAGAPMGDLIFSSAATADVRSCNRLWLSRLGFCTLSRTLPLLVLLLLLL